MPAADDGYKSIWTYLHDLPFTQGYVAAGGIRTRYVQAGPTGAPVLIMLHGLGGSWENCFANLSAHAAHFNTFAIDMLGHGFTDKPDRTHRQPAMKQSMANIFAGIDPDAWRRNALTDDEVAKIESPYLIIAAVDSKDVFLASSYAYSKLIPRAKLIEVNGASHWAQWECVDEFNRINLEFLRAD